MYGSIKPVRPCASCTVAVPNSPSFRTTSVSGRSILRTILGFMGKFSVAYSIQLLNERGRIRDRHSSNLVDAESAVQHLLRKHGKAFRDRRINRLAQIRGKHA